MSKLKSICLFIVLMSCLSSYAQQITIPLSGAPLTACNQVWETQKVKLDVRSSFACTVENDGGIWLLGAPLYVDLSGLQTVEKVEFLQLDYCGTGCTSAHFVMENGNTAQFGNNTVVNEPESLIFDNVNGDTLKEVYITSFEGLCLEVKIWTDRFFAKDDQVVVDSFIEYNVLDNDDIDPQFKPVYTTMTKAPALGSVFLLTDGTLQYTAFPDSNYTDEIEYEVCSLVKSGLCDKATVFLRVEGAGEEEEEEDEECGCPKKKGGGGDPSGGGAMPPPPRFEALYQNAKISKPNIPTPYNTAINSYTGNFIIKRTDLEIPGQGDHLNTTFTYNSASSGKNFGYGNGWTFHHNVKLEAVGTDIIVRRGDGRRDLFTYNGTVYNSPNYLSDTLISLSNGTFELVTKFGTIYSFEEATHLRLTKTTDRNGNETTLTYQDSLVTEITDPYGRTLKFAYTDGQLTSILDDNVPVNRAFSYQYDALRNLRKVTAPDGQSWEYSYNNNCMPVQVKDKLGNAFAIEYDINNAVEAVKAPFIDLEMEYDPSTQKTIVTEVVNGNTQTQNFVFDNLGRVTQSGMGCCGTDQFYDYDTNDNVVKMMDANGNETEYLYDNRGNPVAEIDPFLDTTYLTYTADFNQMSSMIDREGHYSFCDFDAFGNAIKINFPLGISEEVSFDSYGDILSYKSRNGHTTTYQYDSFGNQISITDPVSVSTMSYNSIGFMLSSTNGNGHTSNYEHNWMGLTTKLTNPLGFEWVYAYNANGNLIEETNARKYTTTYKYDALNRGIEIKDPLGGTTIMAYDEKGNLLEQTDPNGNKTIYVYDLENRKIEEQNPSGYTRYFSYDNNNNLLTQSDFRGNVDSFYYDQLDRTIRIVQANGRVTKKSYNKNGKNIANSDSNNNKSKYTYDALGRLLQTEYANTTVGRDYDDDDNITMIMDKLGHKSYYFYNPVNRLDSTINALGDKKILKYDPVGNKIEETDYRGNTTYEYYNAINKLDSTVNALGQTTTYEYDENGNLAKETDANGYSIQYQFDALDRVIKIQRPIGTWEYSYDKVGNQIAEKDGNGNTTVYEYDEQNRIKKLISPNSATILYTYDENGNVTSKSDALGEITQYTFNTNNQLASTTNPEGETTCYKYDVFGNQIEQVLPNGNKIEMKYDRSGRLIQLADSLGVIQSRFYNANGKLVKVIDANNNVSQMIYDELDRPYKLVDSKSDTTFLYYDANSNLIQQTDRKEISTFKVYDAINRVVEMKDGVGNTSTYQFDPVGNLLEVIDGNGSSTNYLYDGNNRLTEEIGQDGTVKLLDYDDNGNLIKRTDQNGQITTFAYDFHNRVIERHYPNDTEYLTYDKKGRLVKTTNMHANLSFEYDKADRKTKELLNGKSVLYNYDILNNTKTIEYPNSEQVTQFFDIRNRLKQISNQGNVIVEFGYDNADRMTETNYANNVDVFHSYNVNNQLVSLSHLNDSALLDYSYIYDKTGNVRNVIKKHNFENSDAFSYDNNYRLSSYQKSDYNSTRYIDYDDGGNREKIHRFSVTYNAYTANQMNEYTMVDNVPQLYESNGNLQDDGVYFYEYDTENRLTTVWTTGQSSLVATYKYDPLGRRIQKIGSTDTINYYYDGHQVIEERNQADNTLATYIYGSSVDDILLMKRNNSDYFYHKNHLGSVMAITDTAGVIIEQYDYDPFGGFTLMDANADTILISQVSNPYLYTSRRLDAETNLFYYRARHYSPTNGRFLQRDPKGFIDGLNLYNYTENNPTNFVDPMGTEKQKKCCGPDVTAWFTAQLKDVAAKAQAAGAEMNSYNPLTQVTKNFVFAVIAKNLRHKDGGFANKECPIQCGGSVTFLGNCINNSELGNIAYGFIGGLFFQGHPNHVLRAGYGLEFDPFGIAPDGFDKVQDVSSTVAGLQLAGEFGDNIIKDIELFDRDNLFKTLDRLDKNTIIDFPTATGVFASDEIRNAFKNSNSLFGLMSGGYGGCKSCKIQYR